MNNSLIIKVVYVVVLIGTVLCQAQSFSYQGILETANGRVKTNHDFHFILYRSQTGGLPVWESDIFLNIPVNDGIFSVTLDPNNMEIFDGKPLYIEVAVRPVGSSIPLIRIPPRQAITPSPYVIKALHHSNIIPAGTIVATWRKSAPLGWLMCDGSALPDDSQYDELKEIVGSHLPDLRGLFMRGLNDFDTEAGPRTDGWQDPEGNHRGIGILQAQDFERHEHWAAQMWGSSLAGGPPFYGVTYGPRTDIASNEIRTGYPTKHEDRTDKDHPIIHGGVETRPNNVAIYYMIKY